MSLSVGGRVMSSVRRRTYFQWSAICILMWLLLWMIGPGTLMWGVSAAEHEEVLQVGWAETGDHLTSSDLNQELRFCFRLISGKHFLNIQ